MHAHCRPPRSLIIDYREWSFQYDQTRLMTDYEQYLFNTKGITLNDLQETVDKATILVKPYLGFFAKMEKIKNVSLGIGFALFLCIAIAVGIITESYGYAALVIIVYILAAFGAFYGVRYTSSKLFRNSQFLLAVFCRAENNRFYLHNGVELRPGYLGKWIEISMIDFEEDPDMLSHMRQRFLKPIQLSMTRNFEQKVNTNIDLLDDQRRIES